MLALLLMINDTFPARKNSFPPFGKSRRGPTIIRAKLNDTVMIEIRNRIRKRLNNGFQLRQARVIQSDRNISKLQPVKRQLSQRQKTKAMKTNGSGGRGVRWARAGSSGTPIVAESTTRQTSSKEEVESKWPERRPPNASRRRGSGTKGITSKSNCPRPPHSFTFFNKNFTVNLFRALGNSNRDPWSSNSSLAMDARAKIDEQFREIAVALGS